MATKVNPNTVEVLNDMGQLGMSVSADYTETMYTAEFGDGNVSFAIVGQATGLRAYTLSWQVSYGFQAPDMIVATRWDNSVIETIQSRPQYLWRFFQRRFSNFENNGNCCWVKDPVDLYWRLCRVLNQKPQFQQGDKLERWSYSLELRQVRAQFSIPQSQTFPLPPATPTPRALIAPEYTWPPEPPP